MTKFLLFVAVLAVIYMLLRASKRTKPPSPQAKAPEEAMAQCAHCGVHFPLNESVGESGRVFCSEDHRRLGVRK
jgi:uncharacterized protein